MLQEAEHFATLSTLERLFPGCGPLALAVLAIFVAALLGHLILGLFMGLQELLRLKGPAAVLTLVGPQTRVQTVVSLQVLIGGKTLPALAADVRAASAVAIGGVGVR